MVLATLTMVKDNYDWFFYLDIIIMGVLWFYYIAVTVLVLFFIY